MLREACESISDHNVFRIGVTVVILIAAVLVGLETYPAIEAQYRSVFGLTDIVIGTIFALEIVIRIGAFGRQWLKFFTEAWNLFDFIVVALCFLPLDANYLAVLRLVRVLRVLRLISVVPRLQMLVEALLSSIPSIGYISLLLFLHFYVYAVVGTFLFGENDPLHFGNLHLSMLSLFEVVTLENWVELMTIQMYGSDIVGLELGVVSENPSASPISAVVFFISFILFGTMVILNLFVGVIMTAMVDMQTETELKAIEQKRASAEPLTLGEELQIVMTSLEDTKQQLTLLHKRVDQAIATKGGSS